MGAIGGWGFGLDACQSQGGTFFFERQGHWIQGRGGAVFGKKPELIALSSEVKIRVAPTVQFAGTAQSLAGARGVGVLAGMMNQENCQTKLAL